MPLLLLLRAAFVARAGHRTRYVVVNISPHLLELRCEGSAEAFCVPRFVFTTNDEFPFVWRRRQFPVRPAFAMTIKHWQVSTKRSSSCESTNAGRSS